MSEKKARKKATTKHKMVVKPPTVLAENARLRKKPKYKSFRLHKRVKHPAGKLPSWWNISKKALRLLKANQRNIFVFTVVYGVLYILFVRGFASPVNVDDIRATFRDAVTEDVSALATNFTVFSLLLQSTTSAAGDAAGLYQVFFLLISVLALIWLFRQQQAGNKVTLKLAFYIGMYPLIPFLLLVVLIGLQTVPATIGNFLFRTVIDNGIAINTFEQLIWLLLFLSLLLLSCYLISSSLIALYIVTLPEMTPKIALKKAKELVQFRRASLLRKVLALAIFVIVLFVATVFPMLFVSSLAAQLLFYVLLILIVPFITAYLFVLYRELL